MAPAAYLVLLTGMLAAIHTVASVQGASEGGGAVQVTRLHLQAGSKQFFDTWSAGTLQAVLLSHELQGHSQQTASSTASQDIDTPSCRPHDACQKDCM